MKREYIFRGVSLDGLDIVYGNLHIFKHGVFIDDIPVGSETIGQYSGLNDINGNEIYEGDIVMGDCFIPNSGKVQKRHVVYFNDGSFMLDPDICLYDGYIKTYNINIIGNIHENNDLIRKNDIKIY